MRVAVCVCGGGGQTLDGLSTVRPMRVEQVRGGGGGDNGETAAATEGEGVERER